MSSSALAASVRQLRVRLASPCLHEESDEQLLHAFLSRREEYAFTVLVRRHGPMVLRVCRRVLGHQQDAEDAFQATFLVLARNAASLRDKTALVSWLHGTAYRTAMKAKQSAARRRKHEKQAPTRSPADPAGELQWREVRTLLDEEIARLPKIYQSVFILCCLEGVSREEAARRLGLKPGTLSSRLTEARKRLAQRLARRGLELTAVLAAATLAARSASALPFTLIATTVKAALASAAGQGVQGLVAAPVVELLEGAASALPPGGTKIATMVVLAAGLLAGAGVWRGAQPQAAVPPAAQTRGTPSPAAPKPERAKTIELHGRVLGPDGAPKAGAKLRLLAEGGKSQPLGVTAADGTFTVAVPREVKDRYLIAQADGLGIDFIGVSDGMANKIIELRLAKDSAIRGRIVTTEGKPVRGARLTVEMLGEQANRSMDAFLAAWKKKTPTSGPSCGVKYVWDRLSVDFTATTDADGRFTLAGLGAERLVALRLRGDGIADAELWIVNRADFDPKPYNLAAARNIPKDREDVGERWLLYGPDLSFAAEAEKPIRGVVKAADTDKGRPSVMVRLTRGDGGSLLNAPLKARTDAAGRYVLHGAHKLKSYLVEVEGDPMEGYMASQVHVSDTPGYQPVTANITLKKGVIITGKMIDQATGKPVAGRVAVGALIDNPFVKDFSVFESSARFPMRQTGGGAFRLVSLPGRVLLMGGPMDLDAQNQYKLPEPDPKYPQCFTVNPYFTAYQGPGGLMTPLQGNYCKVLEIKPDAKIIEQDIVLERAAVLPIPIQDAGGNPLTGTWVAGSNPRAWYPAIQCKDAVCSAYQLQADKPRLLVFFHKARKLAAAIAVKGDEKTPVVAKLAPVGVLTGKLCDSDGKPLAGVVIHLHYRQLATSEIHRIAYGSKKIVTGADGTFTLDDLIPEQKLNLSFHRGKNKFQRETEPAEATIQVKPGEARDLGAIKLEIVPPKADE